MLRHLVHELPHEQFAFFGDSANAPYGNRSADEIYTLSKAIVSKQLADGAKAIVIACNTATSAAAAALREEHPDLPIIGVEPALKPAVLAYPHGRILVMATATTLALEKFQRLEERWGSGAEVIPVACVGLVELIERGDLDAPELLELLEQLIGMYRGAVDAVVLGCTHYPFVARQITEVLGNVPLFDGGLGTARRLRSVLEERDLLSDRDGCGGVTFASSKPGEEEIALYQRFYGM